MSLLRDRRPAVAFEHDRSRKSHHHQQDDNDDNDDNDDALDPITTLSSAGTIRRQRQGQQREQSRHRFTLRRRRSLGLFVAVIAVVVLFWVYVVVIWQLRRFHNETTVSHLQELLNHNQNQQVEEEEAKKDAGAVQLNLRRNVQSRNVPSPPLKQQVQQSTTTFQAESLGATLFPLSTNLSTVHFAEKKSYDAPPSTSVVNNATTATTTKTATTLVASAVAVRRACLARIRRHQRNVLRPYFLGQHHPDANKGQPSVADGQDDDNDDMDVLLVDPAYHSNVGDYMITLGEHALIRRININIMTGIMTTTTTASHPPPAPVWHECHYVQAGPSVPSCAAALAVLHNDDTLLHKANHKSNPNPKNRQSRLALWHGGGNWGDLWSVVHEARIASMETLLRHNYDVVGMPQSLHFGSVAAGAASDKRLAASVARGLGSTGDIRSAATMNNSNMNNATARHRLVLTWREQESYDEAVLRYPFATHLLVPDVAFQLGPYDDQVVATTTQADVDLLLLLRADHESALPSQSRNRATVRAWLDALASGKNGKDVVIDDALGRDVTFAIVDWPDRLQQQAEESTSEQDDTTTVKENSHHVMATALQLLRRGRVVVCDRLHAAILAYLDGLPFVYVNPVTGKIDKTFRVAMAAGSTPTTTATRKGTPSPFHDKQEARLDCTDGEAGLWARGDDLRHALELAVQMLRRRRLEETTPLSSSSSSLRAQRRQNRERLRQEQRQRQALQRGEAHPPGD